MVRGGRCGARAGAPSLSSRASPRAGRCPVRGELPLPSGSYRLRIELHAGRRGQIAAHEFEHRFAPGERWRLTVRMETPRSTPAFDLERG